MEEDDIDIEGDFDLKPTTLSDTGDDDLPSNSAHLQPEFTQHPWVLEQGWTLDNSIDERSKVVIEKMLQEEQFYIDGKTTEVSVPVISPSRPPNKPLSHKKQWTEEEKDMFFKGLDMFGHSWSKISSLIPTRSSQQVKYFAQQHLKQKTKSSILTKPQSRVNQSIQQMLLSVTTGGPTVTSVTPQGKRAEQMKATQRKLNTPQKQHLPKSRLRKEGNTKTLPAGGVTVSHSLEVIRINKASEASSDEEIDVIDTDDTDDNIWTTVSMTELGKRHSDTGGNNSDTGGNNSDTGGNNSDTGGNNSDTGGNNSDTGESHSDPGKRSAGNCEDTDTDTQAENDTEIYTQPSVSDDISVGGDITNKNHFCNDTDVTCTQSGTVFSMSNHRCAIMDRLCGCSTDQSHSPCYSTSDPTHVDLSFSQSPSSPRQLVEGGVYGLQHETEDVSEIGEIEWCGENTSLSEKEKLDTCEGRSIATKTKDPVSNVTATSEEENNTVSVGTVSGEKCDLQEEEDEDHFDEYAVLTSSGDLVYMANPSQEVVLGAGVISEQEKMIHSEFFDNRPGQKTPDRYLRIRTFIIDSWRRCKPTYLTKTSVRPGLRNCGDVNSIGRIHSYLEQLGAINFGCSQVQYNRPVRALPAKVAKDMTTEECQQCIAAERLAIIHARKRRVRDEQGNWVDKGDLEGKTIQHDNIASGSQQTTSKMTKVRRLYDPFLLVPCQRFSLTHPAPFHVMIEYSSLLTMDVHAHLSKTEVIGLLGGDYRSDRGQLHVTTAQPCDSISTGMQCEMDPVSQTEASDAIRAKGQAVVGWYHSHPTFAPNPSVRDLETQHKFQDWFAKGGSPFIGVIVNPYNKQTPSHETQFKCLIVCSNTDVSTTVTNTGVPHEFDFESSYQHWSDDSVLTQVTQLARSYSSYVNRINLLQQMTSVRDFTFLDKIVRSVELYLPEEHRTDPDRGLTTAVSKIMTDMFANCQTNMDGVSEADGSR